MQNCKTSAGTAAQQSSKCRLLFRQAALAAILMLCAVLSSCDRGTGYKRAYIISKSDDNNWTTSGLIECDSFTMISHNEIMFFVDGRKSVLKGQIIKCFSNTSYVSK